MGARSGAKTESLWIRVREEVREIVEQLTEQSLCSTCCMPGTVLSTGDTAVNKTYDLLYFHGACIGGHLLVLQDTHRPVFILEVSLFVVLF